MKKAALFSDDQDIIKSMVALTAATSGRFTIELTSFDEASRKRLQTDEYSLVIVDLDLNHQDLQDFCKTIMSKVAVLYITQADYLLYYEALYNKELSNIYPKALLQQDADTTRKLFESLILRTPCGFRNFLPAYQFIESGPVFNATEIKEMRNALSQLFPDLDEERSTMLKLIFYEISSNCFFHSNKLQKGKDSQITEPIQVGFGEDRDKIVFTVTDKKGVLTRDVVFYYLFKRCTFQDEDLPAESGRGFFLMKSIVDNLIINIKKDALTEFIAIFYKNNYAGEKSILVNEF